MSIQQKVAKALAAGIAKAEEIGSPSSIAILDEGRNLLGCQRMEGAPLASIDISQGKAFTSASMKMNSGDLMEYVQPGGPFFGLEVTLAKPMVVFGGGLYVSKGEFTGAVGVAGGMIDQDLAIAEAVVAAL